MSLKRYVFSGASSDHIIIDWVIKNLNHGKNVNISLGKNIVSNLNRTIFDYQLDNEIIEELPISPYQNKNTEIVIYRALSSNLQISEKFQRVIILHDALNFLTNSGEMTQFNRDRWLEQAQFCVDLINQPSNETGHYFIHYNRLILDPIYQSEVMNYFGTELKIKLNFDNPIKKLIQYQNRILNIEDLNLFNKQLIILSTKFFPKIPIVDHLTSSVNSFSDELKKPQEITENEKPKQITENEKPKQITETKKPKQITETEKPKQITETEKLKEIIKNMEYEFKEAELELATKAPTYLIFSEKKVVTDGEKSLGLSMIVKNEAGIIEKCLTSIVDYLDYWVIHDTGSTDGTQEIILNFFRKHKISGELHYMPWKNFGWNRTQAIRIARKKTDFCILLDADFVVFINDLNFKNTLKTAGYLIRYEGGLDYRQILLINCQYNWEYYGVTHEYIDTKPKQLPVEITEFINILHTGEGSNRNDKFKRDVKLLTQGLLDEPNNARYYFYLGQSYKDWGKYDEAIEAYQRRIDFGNWDEEVFYSYYQIGMCCKRRNDGFYPCLARFLEAFNHRPHRIEPLYQILEDSAYDEKLALLGYQIGMLGYDIKYPTTDLLFIEKPLYDWMYYDLLSTCAYTAKLYPEALKIIERILSQNKFKVQHKERFMRNRNILQRLIVDK